MGSGHILKVRNLTVAFGQVRAVRGVSLSVRAGELMAVFGTNGSGKTTLFKAVAGLIPVQAGRIVWHGEDITTLPAHDRVARGVHYVSDRARVALRMTVRENLDVGGYLRPAAELAPARRKVYEIFPVLEEKADEPAGILSGGERQMLVIGRALMGKPELLLFDEPFLGLSHAVRDRILDVIREALRGKTTILLAEHDVEAAFRVLDRYCVFLNGEIIHQGERGREADGERLREVFRRFYQPGGGRRGATEETG